MDDATIKLILDLGQSGKDVAQVRAELERLETASKDVANTYQVLARAGEGYLLVENEIEAATDRAVRSAVEQTQAQKALNQVLHETGPTAAATSAGVKNIGNSALAASYAIQDFTSQLGTRGLAGGLAAVQNNIPGILAGLGTGAGLAGAASIAAVGIGLLYEHWDKFAALLKEDVIGQQIQKMKDLAKATEEANAANEKAAKGVKGSDETQRGAAFRKALADFGGGEKLLNELAPVGNHNRASYADAIAKALQGSENDIGYLTGVNKKFDESLKRPEQDRAIAEDEAENERRVAAREKRRKEQARLADELNAQGREGERAMDALAGKNNEYEKFTLPPMTAEQRANARAGSQRIQEKLAAGDFVQAAQQQGYDPSQQEIAEAARSITASMHRGLSKDEAAAQAVAQVIQNQQALMMRTDAQQMQWQRLAARARNVQTRPANLPQGR